MMQKQIMPVKVALASPKIMGAIIALTTGILVLMPGPSLLNRLHWLDSGICAQLLTHTFYPGGQALPLCARNTGIYLGFFVTLLSLYASGRGRTQRFPPWPIIILLLCGVAAMAIDGLNSLDLDLGLPHLYQPDNLLRLATGLATGFALAIFILPWLNRFFWRDDNAQRSIASWKMFLLLLPALLACFFAVTAQSTLVVYPIALLSTAGLLMAISSINLIVIVIINKRDESFARYRELMPFFSQALLLAVGEMLLLAELKFALLRLIGL